MYIIDRYILWLFIKILLVCFISLAGLFIVIDAFTNLEEFLSYGKLQGSLFVVLCEYYGARVLTFFDATSALLALIAAIFVIVWMQKSNELTAVQAAGVSKTRIVKPLAIAVAVVSLLAVANRELLIPQLRDKLVRNAQNWMGDDAQPVEPQRDQLRNLLINGRHTIAQEQTIDKPAFQLLSAPAGFGRQLIAEKAKYFPAGKNRPQGYWLKGVSEPKNLADIPSIYADNQPLILTAYDTPWLTEEDECFVVSNIAFNQLTNNSAWRRYASSWELIVALKNPSIRYGADVRVAVHARMVQPLLDLTLLFLGLPLVLTREDRNIFVAAGTCLLVVAGYFVVVLACHALGTYGLIKPHLAAWLPLIIFVPMAFLMSKAIRE